MGKVLPVLLSKYEIEILRISLTLKLREFRESWGNVPEDMVELVEKLRTAEKQFIKGENKDVSFT